MTHNQGKNESKKQHAKPRESIVMGLLAMLGFILWGLLVNWEYGIKARVQVTLTQGTLSLLSTVFSAELIAWLVQKLKKHLFGVFWAGGMSWGLIYALVWLGHLLAGTPEILNTMLPGMIIGIFFCFGYAYRVHISRSRAHAAGATDRN